MNIVIKRYAAGKSIQERMELIRLWDALARQVRREKQFSENELPYFGRVAMLFIAEMRRREEEENTPAAADTTPNYDLDPNGALYRTYG